jgi:uncharacterized protein YdeI (YjbR/CyaY-like superfamily)
VVKAATGVDAPERVDVAQLSFTHRREYVEWVQDAKRPETRTRRVEQTVERVRAGRPPR